MSRRSILHIDFNNFYASVECIDKPALATVPLAVAGDPANRHGIILAKNQLAKAAGVKTAEAIWEAKQKCPNLVCVPPNYDKYIFYSRKAREMYDQYTPLVEPFGLDECWLDVTGSCQSALEIAQEIRGRMKDELRLTVSIGVSYNKIFAKLASDYKKPDAVTEISEDRFREIVWPLPVTDLLMVGSATAKKLRRINITTIGQLARLEAMYIETLLHKPGLMLWQFANGLDQSPVHNTGYSSAIKSIGNGLTTPADLVTWEDIKQTVFPLSEKVAARLRENGFLASTVHVTVRDTSLFSFERQKKLANPTQTAKSISDLSLEIIRENITSTFKLRSLTIRASQLIPANEYRQLSLFQSDTDAELQTRLEYTIDNLRLRFGGDIIKRAIMLKPYLNKNEFVLPEQRVFPVSFF